MTNPALYINQLFTKFEVFGIRFLASMHVSMLDPPYEI